MFSIFISKIHSSWYLSAALQLDIGCFSARPPVLGITCTDVVVCTGSSTSFTVIIAALAALMVAVFGCHYFLLLTRLPCVSVWFLSSSLPYVRLLSFYFWYHVMLLILKKDNTTGSFYLCCLLCVLSVIIKFGAICTSVYSYTIMCTDVVMVYVCPCIILVACAATTACKDMWILQSYG